MTYNYKKPRRINLVSSLIILGLIAGSYAAWKFGPAYWKGYKVDSILSEYKNEAADLTSLNPQYQTDVSERIRHKVYNAIRELGIEDTEFQPLEVGFGPGYSYLYAKYHIVVHHPFGKTTTMKFLRKTSIPKSKNL